MDFATRGRRRKAGYGLSYASECGRYLLYKSDLCGGVPLVVTWLAVSVTDVQRIISRHRTRGGASGACERHARATRPRA